MTHLLRDLAAAALVAATSFQEAAAVKVEGEFEVTMTPAGAAEGGDSAPYGQFDLAKTFTGALVGASTGRMMTAMTEIKGSAAYVAVERFTGALDGKTGAFTLVHRGIMSPAGQRLDIDIVPNSGEGELKSVSGVMTIDIRDGRHFYTLDYELP